MLGFGIIDEKAFIPCPYPYLLVPIHMNGPYLPVLQSVWIINIWKEGSEGVGIQIIKNESFSCADP